MSISRKHAVIRYNFEANCFELIVMGKNGKTKTLPGCIHLYHPDVDSLSRQLSGLAALRSSPITSKKPCI